MTVKEREEAVRIIGEMRAVEDQLTEEQKNVLARYETKLMAQEPAPKQEMSAAGKLMAPMVLPTAGSVALPAAATALAGPANVPFIPLEQAIGSGVGTLGNYALGIEEPSVAGLAASVGLPLAAGYGANALRAIKNLGPSAKGAEAMNRLAFGEAARIAERYKPEAMASTLFKQADEAGYSIATSKTMKAISESLDELTRPSKGAQAEYGRVKAYIQGLEEKLKGTNGRLSPSEMQAELKAAGDITAAFKQAGGAGLHFMGKVKAALVKDLDDAATVGAEGADTLQKARKAFLREETIREITKNVGDRYILKRGYGETRQFNANQVIKDLTENPFFEKAFEKAEQKDIMRTLKMLNKIPPLAPAQGQQYGSGRLMDMAIRGGAGGGAAAAVGQPEMAAALAAAGALSRPAQEVANNFGIALRTREGRAVLKELLSNSDGALTPYVASTLAAYARAKTMEAEPSPEP